MTFIRPVLTGPERTELSLSLSTISSKIAERTTMKLCIQTNDYPASKNGGVKFCIDQSGPDWTGPNLEKLDQSVPNLCT